MKRPTVRMYLLTLCGMLATVPTIAQEPAFAFGHHVVRYEESPGNYHYVYPCWRGICWPVLLKTATVVDGNLRPDHPTLGLLIVSRELIRFLPSDNKSTPLTRDIATSKVAFTYYPKQRMASMSAGKEVYAFTFQTYCPSCDAGSQPIDPNNTAQLEVEYREFEESLSDFDTVQKRITDLAWKSRVGVNPTNEPGPDDPSQALLLYSEVNRQLESACDTETARSCVVKYEKYQACRGNSRTADCGTPPMCVAFCALDSQALKNINSSYCAASTLDYGTLVPNWGLVLNKSEPDRPKCSAPIPAPIYPASPPVDSASNAVACTPAESFRNSYSNAEKQRTLAHGFPSSPDCVPFIALFDPSAYALFLFKEPRSVNVSADVMNGMVLPHTPPHYPAIAKGAGSSGTVELEATISETGTIQGLRVLSGPPYLMQAALETVRTWRYRPYLLNEQPVQVRTNISVTFTQPAEDSGASAKLSTQE